MAGTGKSTTARTIAQSFADKAQLGARFFFKKGEGDRGNASRFFTTVATDLMARVPGLMSGITEAIDADPAISEKALKDQFEKLILQPLSETTYPKALALVVVVVCLAAIAAMPRTRHWNWRRTCATREQELRPVQVSGLRLRSFVVF
ncbi:MAG: hypothetical protein M1839_002548 [Geoglossum umbratile]|nr:MAG: hypothetical protein M1839_002548 [Geoglossum umbratile]